jgi:hypothetical protein
MAKQTVHAVVDRKGYVYRGQAIPKGRVVKMDAALFESTQRSIPSDFREAKASEVSDAETIIDLSTIESHTAQNQAEAEAAAEASEPVARKRGR